MLFGCCSECLPFSLKEWVRAEAAKRVEARKATDEQ